MCLDSSGQPFCIQCKPEYQGPNCEQCSDGFYNADSICLPCNCSGNGDPRLSPRICHPDTGHCLSCINNTTGLHCERCAEGFTGDALARNCTPTGESQSQNVWANMCKKNFFFKNLVIIMDSFLLQSGILGLCQFSHLLVYHKFLFIFLFTKLQLYLKFFFFLLCLSFISFSTIQLKMKL